MNGETRDERLRRLLREADPAAGEPGLGLEEVRAMRRTVLTAVSKPRRRWLPLPALAGAAVAALAVALAMWPGSEPPTAPPREAPRVAAVPRTPPAPVPAAPADPAAAAGSEEPERSHQVAEIPRRAPARRAPFRHRPPATAPEIPARVASSLAPALPETAPEEVETHQVQFFTPGGTRIIWVLTSDKASE